MNKFYMIPNSKDLSFYDDDIILPLKDYSIGFDVYFEAKKIESIAKTRNVSVIINIFLHREKIESIKSIIKLMPSVKYFFVEDLGLLNIIDKSKCVLFQNHIINNYSSISYYKEIGIDNVVVSNELTLQELEEIRSKTTSNLFYFLINRNTLMYSKRKLISSYNDYKGKSDAHLRKELEERVSKRRLIIKEENNSTVIFDANLFSANEVMDDLDGFNFIVNFNNLSDKEFKYVMKYYKDKNLGDYISIDNYFLKNKIVYKVGDVK